MIAPVTITFEAGDPSGMTLGELAERLDLILRQDVDPNALVRVRTKLTATRDGPAIKRVTVGQTGGK